MSNNSSFAAGDDPADKNDGYSHGEHGSKRRRIAIACSACRIRKSRCNGDRPRCDPCQRLGFDCVYEMPESAVNIIVRKDLFATLEDRVKTLEQTIAQHETRIAATESARPQAAALDKGPGSAGRPASAPTVTPDTAISVSLQDTHEQNDTGMTDGMAMALVDEDDHGFFGPSSNISFMKHIFAALAKMSRTPETSPPQSKDTPGLYDQGIFIAAKPRSPASARDPLTSRAAGLDANGLPPNHEIEALLLSYFSNTGLLFPYVHEEAFMNTYRDLQSQAFSAPVRRTWLGLLNMILAMATSTASENSASASSRRASSDIFYRRAQKLCRNQMLRGTTLETVQYLLITTQYLQGTQNSLQTWTIHGLAVKAAFSIGLHSNDILKKFTPLEQEIRKRTWHGCILLDRSLGMTFGRPCSIPQEYIRVDLPTPIGDAREDMSGHFYNATIRLYDILWRVIKNLYDDNLGNGKAAASHTSVITHILQLSHELNEWQTSLPSSLALVSADSLEGLMDESEDPLSQRYRVILTLRHLNTQLLLHRLVLTMSLDNARSDAPTQARKSTNQMERNYILTCIQSAEDIITIVHFVLTSRNLGRRLVGAWWFTLYYSKIKITNPCPPVGEVRASANNAAFNAALAVFGGLLAPMDDEPTARPCSPDRLSRGRQILQSAINALLKLDEGNSVVERCNDYLRHLLRLVDGWIPDAPTGQIEGSTTSGMVHDGAGISQTLLGVDRRGARLLEDPMSFLTNDGMDDLELGPFFTKELQQWSEVPPWDL